MGGPRRFASVMEAFWLHFGMSGGLPGSLWRALWASGAPFWESEGSIRASWGSLGLHFGGSGGLMGAVGLVTDPSADRVANHDFSIIFRNYFGILFGSGL